MPADEILPRPLFAGRLLVFVGIVLVALNLRTAVAAISPIVDRISVDLPLDPVVVGVLGAAPPLAFALSGIVGPLTARLAGLEGALLAAILVMVLGHLGRTLAPDTLVLTIATVATLLGVGVANVLLPPVVKRHFPDRVGLMTALYATVMSVGAAVPALVATPIADHAGWRASLGVWFVSSLVVAAPWIAQLLRGRDAVRDAAALDAEELEPALESRLTRSVLAWSLAGMFAATAINAYAAFAWLPLLLTDTAGVGEAEAGALLALYTIAGFPCALLVPVLAVRLRSVVPLLVAGLAFFVVGDLGLLFAPATATWLWVLLAGLGPLLFPLALLLIGVRSRSAAGAVALSGFVQGIGYTLGAAGPFLVGVLHSATDGWTLPLVFLLAVLVLALPALVTLARPGTVEDELARRARRP